MDILERARLFKEEQLAKAALATSQRTNGVTRPTGIPSTIPSNALPPGIPIPASHPQAQSQVTPSVAGAVDVDALRAAHKAKLAALEESRKQRSGLKSGGGTSTYVPPHKAVATPAPVPLSVVAPTPTPAPVPRAPVSTSLPPRVTPLATYVRAAALQPTSRLYAALPQRNAAQLPLPQAPTAPTPPTAPFSLIAALPPVPPTPAKPLSMLEELNKNQEEFELNLANKEKQAQEIARVEKLEVDLKKVQEQHATVLQEVYKLRAEKDNADDQAREREDRIRQLQHSNDGLRYQLNESERKEEKGKTGVEESKLKTPLTWKPFTLEEAYKNFDISKGVGDSKVLEAYEAASLKDRNMIQIRRDDGAFLTIVLHRGGQASIFRPHLDTLLQKETTAHLASLGFEALIPDTSSSTSHRYLRLIIDLEARVSSLQTQLEGSKVEVTTLKAKTLGEGGKVPSEAEVKNLESEMAKMKAGELEKTREIENLQGKVVELQAELERSANVSDLLKTELRYLEKSGHSRETSHISSRPASPTPSITSTKKALDGYRTIVLKLTAKVKELNAELNAQVAENAELTKKLIVSAE